MKQVIRTDRFKRLYRKLPDDVKKKFARQMHLLLTDPRNPSVRAQKMVNREDVWEARIGHAHQFTFTSDDRSITLRAIGTHEIYRHP
jgi:mRNA interferase RelE/StbE